MFDTHEAVTKHLTELAKSHGVVIVKKNSDHSGKRTSFILYQCQRGGWPRDHCKGGKYEKKIGGTGKRKPRESSTSKCGCNFLLKTTKNKYKEEWDVRVLNGVHNHTTFKFAEGHPYLGRLDKEQVQEVERMTVHGIKPRNILRVLRSKDKNCSTSQKKIYNVRATIKKKAREGRTVMQEVYKLADRKKAFVHCRHDGDNTVQDVFWAYYESLALARCFPYVMLMDCTYKTNKYKLPLLQIVGVTSTDNSFSVGFALLHLEREDNYTWALNVLRQAIGEQSDRICCIVTDREEALMNAVRVVFPKAKNLLCRWHIEKGLVSNLKTKTTSESWQDLMGAWLEAVKANTEEELNGRLDEFKKSFGEEAMDYVSSTWLNRHKEAFVSAWTNSVFHLGNTSTSRVEGMHSVFKNWLGTGLGDMVADFEAGVSAIDQEIKNIKKSFETSLFMEPKKFKDEPLFKELKYHVSIFALGLLHDELKIKIDSDDLDEECGCTIRKTHGLPCRHEMARYKKKPGCIPISSIHIHWRTLDINGPPPNESDLDYVPVLHAIEEKMKMATPWERQMLTMKLRDIYDPTHTVLQDPKVKKTSRGRPKGAGNKKKVVDDNSTKREKCSYERVEELIASVNDSIDPEGEDKKQSKGTRAVNERTSQGVSSGNKRKCQATREPSKRASSRKKSKSTFEESTNLVQWYLNCFPDNVHEHISSLVDVIADGNCGYRVIAVAIGLEQSDWPTIRKAVQTELMANKDHYMALFGGQEWVYNKCVTSVDHFQGSCGPDKYFESFVGWAVCNIYGVSISILSKTHGNQTFLPTKEKPSVWPPNHIWMGFCYGNHFVRLFMKDSCPMPKVSAVWSKVRSSEASQWHDKLRHRLGLWQDVVKDPWAGIHFDLD